MTEPDTSLEELAPPVPPAQVVADTLAKFSLTIEALRGRGRSAWLASARRYLALRLRDIGMSYRDIGDILGGRDHTTILKMLQA